MSGAEAGFVVGLISGLISIIEATKTVYDAAKDAKGQPEAFRQAQTLDESAQEAQEEFLESLKNKAEKLEKIFRKVIRKDDDKWYDRYKKAVETVLKGQKVECLMEGILKDIQVLTCERLIGTATDAQEKEMEEAIKEMNQMPSSLEDEAGRVTQNHQGSGNNNANTGRGSQHNGTGDLYHNEIAGDAYFGSRSVNQTILPYSHSGTYDRSIIGQYVTVHNHNTVRREDAMNKLKSEFNMSQSPYFNPDEAEGPINPPTAFGPSNDQLLRRTGTQSLYQPVSFLYRVLGTILPLVQSKRTQFRDSEGTDLSWFTNTTMYHAWKTPARNPLSERVTNTTMHDAWTTPARSPVLCSRFIWYAGNDRNNFATSYIQCQKLIETDILYIDCDAIVNCTQTITRAGKVLNLTTVGLAMWTLIAQALKDRSDQDLLDALHEICEQVPQVSISLRETRVISYSLLQELLKEALNLTPSRDATIILDRIDALDKDKLFRLRNVVQNVLDDQRTDEAAPTRVIVIGPREDKTNFALKGTAEIDELSECRECSRALSFENMDLRRSRVAQAAIGTNHWIWNHEVFMAWQEQNSATLWVSGKPGSGKSVLARSIEERFYATSFNLSQTMLQTTSPFSDEVPLVASWFYSERENLRSHAFMLRAVLLQILKQNPDVFHHFTSIYRSVDPFEAWQGRIWTVENLECILRNIVVDPGRRLPILIVLDGVDESQRSSFGNQDRLSLVLPMLTRLVREASMFKLILLSRDHPDIEQYIRNAGRIIMRDANEPDILKVVENGILSLQRIFRRDDSGGAENSSEQIQSSQTIHQHFRELEIAERRATDEIQYYLVQRADGVILWVKLCLAALETKAMSQPFLRMENLATDLRHLPSEMTQLYEEMVDRLSAGLTDPESQKLAGRAITWIRKATESRRLRILEILDALSIPADIDEALQRTTDPLLNVAGIHSLNSIRVNLLELLGSFIEFTNTSRSMPQNNHQENQATEDEELGQVQLVHQTAKMFLEQADAAKFLKIPKNFLEIIQQESSSYIKVVFPSIRTDYDPLQNATNASIEGNVIRILAYLERKPLFSYIYHDYSDLHTMVPVRYRRIFQHTTDPPTENISELQVIAELYFHTACKRGWATAIENFICLQTISLRSREATPDWYLFETSAIQGALRAAIRRQLLPEIRLLAWYVAERGLDLLDFPTEGRDDALGNSVIIKEAIETGNQEVAMIVIGYDTDAEKEALLAWLQHSESNPAAHSPENTDEVSDMQIRKAIWTVMQFWGSPPKQPHPRRKTNLQGNGGNDDGNDDDPDDDRRGDGKEGGINSQDATKEYLSVLEDLSSSLNPYGANMYFDVGNFYDANIYDANIFTQSVIGMELNTYGTEYGSNEMIRRRSRLSHKILSTTVSILRGGRNLYNPRLPGIPRVDAMENVWAQAQRIMLENEMLDLDGMRTQNSEMDFLEEMNDALRKVQ